MRIEKIEVEWWKGYGNSPELVVYVDKLLSQDDFLYFPVEGSISVPPVFLLSTNNHPWYRFVYVDEKPNGDPSLHGALGGMYKLTDGTVFKTRTGWSSRAGVVNKRYREHLDSELIEPTVVDPTGFHWAGYAHAVSELLHNDLFPKGVYLVRDERNGEPRWTPSVDPNEVVKRA